MPSNVALLLLLAAVPTSAQKPRARERSDTKAHDRDEAEDTDAKDRIEAEHAEADERLALKNAGQKGPQHL